MSKDLTLKDKLYLKNLKDNKFNKTKAYLETYPTSSYRSSNVNTNRKMQQIVRDSPISIESLISKSNIIIEQLYTDTSVKIQKKADIAVQLTKRQVTDKQSVAGEMNIDLKARFIKALEDRGIDISTLMAEVSNQ